MRIGDYLRHLGQYIIHGIPITEINIVMIDDKSAFKDKSAIVTGGSSGIGYSIAEKLINGGVSKVIITGRDKNKLMNASRKLGEKCVPIQFDSVNLEESRNFIKKAKRELDGEIDLLICCAGITYKEHDISEVTVESYQEQMNVNLAGTYFMCQSYINEANLNKEHSILIISSERGIFCDDRPYGISKAALNSLIKGLARRYAGRKIRVNGIAPGTTVSNMTNIKKDDLYCEWMPSKRYFLPQEIAETAVFLLSDVSKCITGEIIACDYGFAVNSFF